MNFALQESTFTEYISPVLLSLKNVKVHISYLQWSKSGILELSLPMAKLINVKNLAQRILNVMLSTKHKMEMYSSHKRIYSKFLKSRRHKNKHHDLTEQLKKEKHKRRH